MARVLFIQDIAYEYMGVMYMSAFLKEAGHDCNVIIEALDDNIDAAVRDYNPDIIGFSTLSGSFRWAVHMAGRLKDQYPDLPIIFGGVHVYSNPQKVMQHQQIDIICTGEGEIPLKRLCDSIDQGKIDTSIAGLWFRSEDEIIKNRMQRLIDDLDGIPFADRQLYWKYPSIESRTMLPVLGSRGCPYTCAYCFVPTANEIFKDQGILVRQRSAENIVKEIRLLISENPTKKTVHFVEDHFGNNRTRSLEVLEAISSIIPKVKWTGAIRIERFIEEWYVENLSKTNFHVLGLAIETGNEEFRNTVLQRETLNEDIIKAADLANKYGIRFTTLNMIGLPGETFEMAKETLELNIRVKPEYAHCYVYQPYPGTKLQEYAVEHNFFTESVSDELGFSFYDRYNKKDKDLQKVINIQRVFGIIVEFPVLKRPLLALAKTSGTKLLLDGIFGLYYMYYLLKYFDLSPKMILPYIKIWFKGNFNKKTNLVSKSIAKGEAPYYSTKSA